MKLFNNIASKFNFLKENRARNFFYCMISISILLIIFLCGFAYFQADNFKDILFDHDEKIYSSLLEQGVSEEIIVKVIESSKNNSDEESYITQDKNVKSENQESFVDDNEKIDVNSGKEILTSLGYTNKTSLFFIPSSNQLLKKNLAYNIIACSIFELILLFIVIYFLSEREIVYQEITKYLEGKVDKNKIKSSHIDKKKTKSNNIEHFALNNGNLYVLFNEIEKLTDSLKEKSEKEYNAKEFIKMSVSDISHQIKTPLAAIKMYNEIILEEPKNHDLIMDFSVNISKSICRIEELIKTLLKLSRIDSESITFKKDKYSISDLIEKSIQELSVRAINEGKKIEVIGSKKDEIFCDFNWTVEAIENIIKNALDNTREGCFVRIMWEKFDTIFSITIEDNGKGIDEKDIHHIFKRFYRSEDSGNLQGVGLGLSLTKSIVEKQGGTVSVKSEKGIGTQFSLVFLNEM